MLIRIDCPGNIQQVKHPIFQVGGCNLTMITEQSHIKQSNNLKKFDNDLNPYPNQQDGWMYNRTSSPMVKVVKIISPGGAIH